MRRSWGSRWEGRGALFIPAVIGCLFLSGAGCHRDMYDQPREEPLTGSSFYDDGLASRPIVEGTVPHGTLLTDSLYTAGKVGGTYADVFPFPITREVLERGRERFTIFCSPCHGALGNGDGMVVRRGFSRPPSYHTDRLREAPEGYFFDVMTNGFGRMYPYASRVRVRDRWAIIAYIRALQLSQNAGLVDVPPGMRQALSEEAE